MRVLVTGGSGWIGRATCKALQQRGHEPVVFDRTSGHDVTNQHDVTGAVDGVDHVIHLAGLLGTHELLHNVHEAVAVNVMGAVNVTAACALLGRGLTEITMPRVNPSVYAATKACAMDLAEALRHANGLGVSYVRAYNAYGPGQAYGGDHPQKIIPTFATAGWRSEPIPVWGDGSLWVDLVHVDDVARMLVEAMAFSDGQVFDAGTGYIQTVRGVAEQVIALTGSVAGIKYLEPRPGERLFSTDADVSRREGWELLNGWHPVFDPERFAEAVDSYSPKAVRQ